MFTVGEFFPFLEEPDPELLVQIGWKGSHYDFQYLEAAVLANGNATASWIEIAFSPQLGGAFVLWRSGVSALEAARSVSYGWVECGDVQSIPSAIETKASAYGPALKGFHFDTSEYYRMYPGQIVMKNGIMPSDRPVP